MKVLESILSEKGKISIKRVLALAFSLVCIYLLIFTDDIHKIDGLYFFIGSLLALTVANKHKALQVKDEEYIDKKK